MCIRDSPTGVTGIADIFRIIPGRTYTWRDSKLSFEPISIEEFKIHKEQSSKLEDVLSEVMTSKLDYSKPINNSEIGVLVSGGIDSIILVQCLLNKNIKPVLITAVAKDGFDSSAIDAYRSKVLCDYWGLEHHVAEVPLDKNSMIECWHGLRESTPMAVHTGIFFDAAFKKADQLGIKTIYSGQNADTFYNLGPTSKLSFNKSDIADTFRRFFLSDYFIKSLPESFADKGVISKLKNLPSRFMLFLGARILNFMIPNQKVYPPKNIEEAVVAYKNRPDYIIFPNKDDINQSKSHPSSQGFFEDIYTYKIESFVMTGAPQVIYSYGNKYNIDVELPFSSKSIISNFFNMPKKLINVLSPKKEIYQSSKRLDKNLPTFKNMPNISSNYPSYHEWLIKKWSFINKINGLGKSELKNAGDFMGELSKFWLK